MEEKIEQNKENERPNNEILNFQQKIKELNNKMNILIKGIKEEREKSKELTNQLEEERKKSKEITSQIEALNLDKILKEETISKLKSENESLNLMLSKDDPKSYFESITQLNADISFNPEEYDSVKKENVHLKEENKALMEQNTELINKIEKLSDEKKLTEKNLNEEIYKLKKERVEQTNEIFDKQKKIEILNNLYKEIEIQKNNKENEIIKYKEEEKNCKKQMKNLENQINVLKNISEKDNIEISKLKKEIEDKIKIEIDDYIFKGIIVEDNFNKKKLWNKNIQIKFNSNDIFIKLNFCGKIYEIDIKNIKFTFFEKTKDKVIIFYEAEEEQDEDEEKEELKESKENIKNEEKEEKVDKKGDKKEIITNAMLCKFTERECNYIFEFKKEMMEKYKENKAKKEKEENTFSSFIYGFFG